MRCRSTASPSTDSITCADGIEDGRLAMPERRVGDRGDQERSGDDAERRHIAEPPREDDRPDGVADGDAADLDDGRTFTCRRRGRRVAATPTHPDEQAEPAAAALSLAFAGEADDDRADERDRGDQEPGERARQLRLGAREQHPGDRDLDHRVGEQRPPAREQRAEVSAQRGERRRAAAQPRPCAGRRASPAPARARRRGSSGTERPRSRTSPRRAARPRRFIPLAGSRSASSPRTTSQRRQSRGRSRGTTGRSRRSGRAGPRGDSR